MKTHHFLKVPTSSPDDTRSLDIALEQAIAHPRNILGIIGKTEGNGCVNDFTRGFATSALHHYLRPYFEEGEIEKLPLIMSGGCEGAISPHLNVFYAAVEDEENPRITGGMVIARTRTRDFRPEEIGTSEMTVEVASTLTRTMEAHHLSPGDVHFVQIKCPLLRSEDIAGAKLQLATRDPLKSMGLSRGAASLGVALALRELPEATCREARIGEENEHYSTVASASAGIELQCCEILLLANASWSTSPFRVGHDVMAHALDQDSIRRAACASQGGGTDFDPGRIAQVFAKAEADPTGRLLDRRHTMLQDSDISPTRMARAVVGSLAAAVTGDPCVYVSGGAEHQGPPGGGPVAVISRIAP